MFFSDIWPAGHEDVGVVTGHIGTNIPKFLPPRWGRPRFDPTQTGLCKFGSGFGARWISLSTLTSPILVGPSLSGTDSRIDSRILGLESPEFPLREAQKRVELQYRRLAENRLRIANPNCNLFLVFMYFRRMIRIARF